MKMFAFHSLTLITAFFLCLAGNLSLQAWAAEEVFGPPNMLKTVPTPFGPAINSGHSDEGPSNGALTLDASSRIHLHGLGHRLVSGSRVYLPSRMTLGKSSEFVIKGRPGSQAAISMADKNSGSKPIYGQSLRLGSDRKLVSLGTIPETGVLSLCIETPIQGDLLGEHLYFETVVWSKPDFSDMEIATPVKSEITDTEKDFANGILVTQEVEQKKGVRFVPASPVPFYQQQRPGALRLDSGRP